MSHAGTVTRWHAPADHKSACKVMSAGNGPEQCSRQSRHALLRCMSPLSAVKRTSLFAAHMSAFDPKRTCATPSKAQEFAGTIVVLGVGDEAARFHQSHCGFSGRMAAYGACAAGRAHAAARDHYRRSEGG